jgi:hypothetical protein
MGWWKWGEVKAVCPGVEAGGKNHQTGTQCLFGDDDQLRAELTDSAVAGRSGD